MFHVKKFIVILYQFSCLQFFIYNDLNDSGMIPEEDRQVELFDTKRMQWSLNSSKETNASVSMAFRMTHYDGSPLDPHSNIEITVN